MSSPYCRPDRLRKVEPVIADNDQIRDKKFDRSIPVKAGAAPVVCQSCGSIPTLAGTETPPISSTPSWLPLSDCSVSCSSSCNLAPTFSTSQEATITSHPPLSAITVNPAPIHIPPPTLRPWDINRVPTPLSGRGDRKGHLFPFDCSCSRSPSPAELTPRSHKKTRALSNDSDGFFGRLDRPGSASSSSSQSVRSHCCTVMHDPLISNLYPTSPLSSRPSPSRSQAISPPPGHRRGNHGRQASRTTQNNPGRYHPSNFPQADPLSVLTSAATQAPAPSIVYTRAPPATQIESPRMLREKHRAFLEREKLSSKLAASPLAVKPDAPRLDPLGSPKGPMTPLELAEDADGDDYFGLAGVGRVSPVATPGAKSPRSNSLSGTEDAQPKKARKIDLYP